MKLAITIICTALSLYAYILYLSSILKRDVKPHFFTWLTWSIASMLAIILMIVGGGGIGVLPTAVGGIACVTCAITSFKHRADARPTDYLFLGMALLAIPVWLLLGNPELSSMLLASIMTFGTISSIRKAYRNPHHEATKQWLISGLRFGLSVAGLSTITITTAAFPVVMTLNNLAVFAAIMLGRMKNK